MSFIYYTKDFPNFYICHDFYKFFQAGFGGEPGLIDRTGNLNYLSNKNIISLYPFTYNNTDTDLFTIINSRATEIISKNKTTDVFWSGGIDSTCALVALIINSDNNWQKQYLRIICNNKSILENNHLYQKIKNKFQIINIPQDFILPYYNKHIFNDSIIVTGEMADQIMGSHFCFIYNEIAILPYEEALHIYIKYNTKFNDAPKQIIENINLNNVIEIIENNNCPYKIDTLYDLLTWININFTWDFNCNRYLSEKIKIQNLYNFFNTQDFTDWAIINHYKKYSEIKNGKGYKLLLKEYINQYLKDDYAFSMRKQTSPSTSSNIYIGKKIIAIDTDFNIYYNTKIDLLRCLNESHNSNGT